MGGCGVWPPATGRWDLRGGVNATLVGWWFLVAVHGDFRQEDSVELSIGISLIVLLIRVSCELCEINLLGFDQA